MGTNKVALSRIEVADLIRPTTQMAPLFGDGTADEALVIEEHVPTLSGEHAVIAQKDSLQVPIVDLRASGLVPIETGPVGAQSVVQPAVEESTAPLSLTRRETDAMSAIAKANDAAMATVIVDDTATEMMEPLAKPEAMSAFDRALVAGPVDRTRRPSVDESIIAATYVPEPPALPAIPEHAAARRTDNTALPSGSAASAGIPSLVDNEQASDATARNRSQPTALGVAPLAPATTVTAPYVNDTPVERWKPARPARASSQPPDVTESLVATAAPPAGTAASAGVGASEPTARGSFEIPKQTTDTGDQRHERTAMVALDPRSGLPRSGPWQAIVAVGRSLRSVRWWLRNRISTKTKQVKPF